jgi:glycosyltransferase involved in cell wall biosynthesis
LWPRGVDTDLFAPAPAPLPAERDGGRIPVALYVGRLAAEKGLLQLSAIADPDSGIQLVLVGDGPFRAELERRFGTSAVQFPGVLHGEALAQAYRDADVFVFPSTTETLGLVLLEALASGLPIIAAESPASHELLADCPTARLFSQEDPAAILDLVRSFREDPPSGPQLTQMRQRALEWGWEAATAKLLEHYRTAMRKSESVDVSATASSS